jgi:hypothetical protein
VGAISSWVVSAPATNSALLRLSWRAVGRELEMCRALSTDEIAKQPVHMRRTEVCERTIEPYRLHVAIDGVTRVDTVLQPTGARRDRPLYVLRDFVVPPGQHEVDVLFAEEEPRHVSAEQRNHFPDALAYRSTVGFRSNKVVLLTYDADRRDLIRRD